MSCMTMLFSTELVNHQIRPIVKWVVSLEIADSNLVFLGGWGVYVWINIFTLYPLGMVIRGHIAGYNSNKTAILPPLLCT